MLFFKRLGDDSYSVVCAAFSLVALVLASYAFGIKIKYYIFICTKSSDAVCGHLPGTFLTNSMEPWAMGDLRITVAFIEKTGLDI